MPCKPKINQIVTVPWKKALARALITNAENCQLFLVDYGIDFTFAESALLNSNEKLASMPSTLLTVGLKGVMKFSGSALEEINNCIKTQEKFSAVSKKLNLSNVDQFFSFLDSAFE